MGSFLKYLFQIILSPTSGWEDVGAALDARLVDVRRLYVRAFLPLIAICSASAFVRLLFGEPYDALWCLATAIISFVVMFLTYHISIYAISSFMPRLIDDRLSCSHDQRQLALVVMMSVAFIALVVMVRNVVKVNLAIIDFLPFYVGLRLWKASRFLCIDRRQEGLYMIVAAASVLGSFYLLGFLFGALI